MPANRCPFCGVDPARVLFEDDVGLVYLDRYPVSRGHTLVVPKRHVESIFNLSPQELGSLWGLIGKARERLAVEYRPDGFTIGVNDGPAAGQTVGHAHIHIIPRYAGDVPDPRGGVRWVIPDKARYW